MKKFTLHLLIAMFTIIAIVGIGFTLLSLTAWLIAFNCWVGLIWAVFMIAFLIALGETVIEWFDERNKKK